MLETDFYTFDRSIAQLKTQEPRPVQKILCSFPTNKYIKGYNFVKYTKYETCAIALVSISVLIRKITLISKRQA